jgi:hypothetical protein
MSDIVVWPLSWFARTRATERLLCRRAQRLSDLMWRRKQFCWDHGIDWDTNRWLLRLDPMRSAAIAACDDLRDGLATGLAAHTAGRA